MKLPQKGDKIYIPTSLHVYRGLDDFIGGICTISEIETSKHLPPDHFNYIMIGIEERPGHLFNYKNLLEQQDSLKERFGNQKGYSDPDYRSEFNDDDADWK